MKKLLLTLSFVFTLIPISASAQRALTVYNPHSGAQVNYNQTYTVSWSPVSGATTVVYVERSDGSNRQEIGSTPAVNTSMDWVPASLSLKSGQYRLFVQVIGGPGKESEPISEGYSGFFSIVGNDPQSVPVNLKVVTNITGNTGSLVSAAIAGYSSNNSVSYWKLAISCGNGAVVSNYQGNNICGTEYRYDRYNIGNPSSDYVMITSFGLKNNSTSQQNVVFALTAYDGNNNNIGGDKDGVVLGANTPVQTVTPTQTTYTQPVTTTVAPTITVAPTNMSEVQRQQTMQQLQQLLASLIQQLIQMLQQQAQGRTNDISVVSQAPNPTQPTPIPLPSPAPTIDFFSVNGNSQVDGSGKIQVYNVINPVVQWSSSNASYCRAISVEGVSRAETIDFTGTQQISGSQQLMFGNSYYNQREITLTCYNKNGIPSNTVSAWIGGKG